MKSLSDPESSGLAERLEEGAYQQWVPPKLERRSKPRPTDEDADAIREAARKAGFAQGLADAELFIDEQRRELSARFNEFLTIFSKPLSRLDDEVEQTLAELAMVIAGALLRSQVDVRPDVVLEVARDAIQALPHDDRKLRLVMHPEDAQLAQGLRHWCDDDRDISIVADEDMERGGCRVEGDFASVDASVEARIEAAGERLREGLEQRE